MTTYKRTRRDAKKASQQLKKGDTFYVECDVAQNIAPYEDGTLLQRYTVTGTHPILGGAMVGGQSVEGIVLRDGPAYTERPAGIRGLWEPSPQVAGPLSKTDRRLNAREIRELEREVTTALERRYGKSRAKKEVAAAKGDQKQLQELVRR